MKQNYFKKLMLIGGVIFGSMSVNSQVTTFNYTGSMQTYTVPIGVTSLKLELYGGAGYGNLGLGGKVEGVFEVTPGDVLNIFVGGAGGATTGGYNGGGVPGSSSDYGGGGGASDIRLGGLTLADRIIVAGGGGGSGSNCGLWSAEGGHGGGLIGESGCLYSCSDCQYTGSGGSQVAAGIAGPTDHGSCDGNNNGEFGIGGSNSLGSFGTGGGGGYYGGGSGCFEGAGGGSSYTHPDAEDVVHIVGVQDGNGQVIITVLCEPLTVTVSSEEICLGDSFTLDASGDGAITWDGGVINGEPFTPASAGTVTYTATSDDPGDCGFSVDIAVLESPELSYVLTDEVFGGDGEINLTVIGGEPGYLFDWDNDGTGDFDDTEDLTGLVGGTYVVVVQDDAGCSGMETITLNSQVGVYENEQLIFSVYPNPTADQFSIESEGSFTYQIVDVNGALVLNGVGTNLVQVSLSNYAKGSYFVKLNINGNEHVLQLVKQ